MHAGTEANNQVTLDLVRHGEPAGGVLYRGSKDDPLSETGWQQLRSTLSQAIEQGNTWDQIISSPMLRCCEFAKEAGEKLRLTPNIVEGVRELSFGDLEGMRPKDAWEKYPELLSEMWKDPFEHTPPNGEPFTDFVARIDAAMRELIVNHKNQHLLLVVHGGVIRAAIHNLLKVTAASTFRMDIPYASMTRFNIYLNDDDSFEASLAFLNGIQHRITEK